MRAQGVKLALEGLAMAYYISRTVRGPFEAVVADVTAQKFVDF
jgi:hypothetical protein